MDSLELNKDYILTIVKTGEQVELIEQKIVHNYKDLIDFLKQQVENDRYSIFQMEDKFFSSIPDPNVGFSYLYPYSYTSSYVDYVFCPSRIDQKEFKTELNKKDSETSKRLYEEYLKRNFVDKASRFIMAFEYNQTLDKIRESHEVKMYSSDLIGWTIFNFNINEDVQVNVRTNFGYGSSSYFTLLLKYKGINIIPYSHIVEYYYANAIDIIRCTESYSPIRENWKRAMTLVIDAANAAMISSDSFINKYIIEECRKMITELRILNSDSKCFYDRISTVSHSNLKIYNVRDIDGYRRELYEIYPDEVLFTFRCEKVSGALHFLDNLTSQAEYIPEIETLITELKSMNRNLIPEIDCRIPQIENQIKEAELKKQVLENEKSEINKEIEPHIKIIENIKEERKRQKEQKGETVYGWILSNEITQEYKNKNEDFKDLQDKLYVISDMISKLSTEIIRRSEFKKMLLGCRELIEEKVLSTVA